MTDIVKFIDKSLPISVGNSGIQYSQSQNMMVTTGYTSYAGNTYFKGIRLSDRIFIVLDIGIGYAYRFLNGITIYANSEKEKKVVGKKSYYCTVYSEAKIKEDTKKIIRDELIDNAQKENLTLDEPWLTEFIHQLVEDTYKNQIETIKTMQLNNLLTK